MLEGHILCELLRLVQSAAIGGDKSPFLDPGTLQDMVATMAPGCCSLVAFLIVLDWTNDFSDLLFFSDCLKFSISDSCFVTSRSHGIAFAFCR